MSGCFHCLFCFQIDLSIICSYLIMSIYLDFLNKNQSFTLCKIHKIWPNFKVRKFSVNAQFLQIFGCFENLWKLLVH